VFIKDKKHQEPLQYIINHTEAIYYFEQPLTQHYKMRITTLL